MHDLISDPGVTRIRALNDALRMKGEGGRTVLTRGISGLPPDELVEVLRAVAAFATFDIRNDPHGEHDCAILETEGGQRVLWKIDYYDPDLQNFSPDPANPDVTKRVLTIMLAEEY